MVMPDQWATTSGGTTPTTLGLSAPAVTCDWGCRAWPRRRADRRRPGPARLRHPRWGNAVGGAGGHAAPPATGAATLGLARAQGESSSTAASMTPAGGRRGPPATTRTPRNNAADFVLAACRAAEHDGPAGAVSWALESALLREPHRAVDSVSSSRSSSPRRCSAAKGCAYTGWATRSPTGLRHREQMGSLLFSACWGRGYLLIYEHARLVTLPTWAQWVLRFVVSTSSTTGGTASRTSAAAVGRACGAPPERGTYNLASRCGSRSPRAGRASPSTFPSRCWESALVPFATASALSLLYQAGFTPSWCRGCRASSALQQPAAHRVHHAPTRAPRQELRRHAGHLGPGVRHLRARDGGVVYGVTQPLKSFNALWRSSPATSSWPRRCARRPASPRRSRALPRPGWNPTWRGLDSGRAPLTLSARLRTGSGEVRGRPSAAAKGYALVWFALGGGGDVLPVDVGPRARPAARHRVRCARAADGGCVGGLLEGRPVGAGARAAALRGAARLRAVWL